MPCPAGLVVVLVAFNLKVMTFGLVVLTAFSMGLGMVLVTIAVAMALSRTMLEKALGGGGESRIIQVLPMISAVLVIGVGHLMVADAFYPGFLTAVSDTVFSRVSGVFGG